MKKLALLILLGSLFATAGMSQDGEREGRKNDKIKAMRIAFITEKLQLTPEEAQQFWPIYNKNEGDRKDLRKAYKGRTKPANRISEMSDAEVEALISANLEMEEKQFALKKTFIADMREVLPPKKIALLLHAERAFKERILNMLGKKGHRPDKY